MKCSLEVSPDCDGHEGWRKFSSCLAEVAYLWPDDITGSVDGFGTWVGLMIQEKAERIEMMGIDITIPAGTYAVVREDEQGFIGFEVFDTAEAAQDRFDDWSRAYGLYLADQEHAEHTITSSTGRIGA